MIELSPDDPFYGIASECLTNTIGYILDQSSSAEWAGLEVISNGNMCMGLEKHRSPDSETRQDDTPFDFKTRSNELYDVACRTLNLLANNLEKSGPRPWSGLVAHIKTKALDVSVSLDRRSGTTVTTIKII